MRTIAGLLMSLSVVACAATPPEYMPHPRAEVTKEQWLEYHQRVVVAYGSTRRTYPDEHLEIFGNTEQRIQFAFTMEGHPAHPAWITRQVLEKDGRVSANQIGYYAGREEPFAQLFRAYRDLTDRTVRAFREDTPK